MTPKEKEALQRIKESLNEFPEMMMAQYITRKDLETLVRLIERNEERGEQRT